jgi:hypothetical protein
VFVNKDHGEPKTLEHGSVQLKNSNRRPPGWGKADDFGEIRRPREVVTPPMHTRIEKRHQFAGEGIERIYARVLERIASGARKRQVVKFGQAAATARDYVILEQLLRRHIFGSKAVLATSAGPRCDQLAQRITATLHRRSMPS